MPSIYDLFQINPDEAEAIGYASKLSPAEGLMADRRLFEQRAVRGIEGLGRTALGLPQSPQADRQAAAAELTALAQKVRPGTAEFYEAAIPILQKYNMPAEAEKMQQQLAALDTAKLGQSPVLKLQHDKDVLLKRPDAASPNAQAAIAAIDRELALKGTRPEQAAATHNFTKLLNDYEAALAAGQTSRAEFLKKALDAELLKMENAGNDTALLRLELEKLKFEYIKGKDARKVEADEATAVAATQAFIGTLDVEYQTVNRLLNHPGRDAIFGSVVGAGPLAVSAAFSQGAGALYEQLQGQVFIRALQDLKATSKTGASGLGQLTEIEGGKIQVARIAMGRQQPPAQFVRTLNMYATQLANSRQKFADWLVKQKASVPAPLPPISDASGKIDPRAITAPKAAPSAPATRTFNSTPVE